MVWCLRMVLSAAGKAEVCGPTDLSHGALRGTGSLAAGPLGSQELGSPGGAGRLSSPAAVFERQRVGPGEGVLLASTDVSREDPAGSGNWLNSGGDRGWTCSKGGLYSCPPRRSRPSSKLTRDLGYNSPEARYPPYVNPVQRTPRQFAHLRHPLDQVLLPNTPSYTACASCMDAICSCLRPASA